MPRVVALVPVMIGLAACTSVGSATRRPFETATQTALRTVVTQAMAGSSIPGAVVGVWAPEGEWVEALGVADVTTRAPMTTDVRFRIGSQTKTFVATVILQLVDEGRLSLDDTIERWFPALPHAREITVAMILDHRSGLYNYTENEPLARRLFKDPLTGWTPQELLALAASGTPSFPPGTSWHYSNTNYLLQGLIIERLTGHPLVSEVTTRLIEPLRLSHTTFPHTDPTLPAPYAHGYVFLEDGLPTEGTPGAPPPAYVDYTIMNPSWAWAAGGIVGTLADMRTWTEALTRGGLLEPATQQARLASVFPVPPGDLGPGRSSFGLGIIESGGFYGHQGGITGFNSISMHSPELNTTIVLAFNKLYNHVEPMEVLQRLALVLYPHLAPRFALPAK